jgi:hypothetical protein
MTAKQRHLYLLTLWPAACEAQGWEVRDITRRQAVTLYATGQESSKGLDNRQITRLFDYLAHLAQPDSLQAAMAHANPDLADEADKRRQLVWAIQQLRFADRYIQQTATGAMRSTHETRWQDLPLEKLHQLRMTLKARAQQRAVREGKRPPIHRTKPRWAKSKIPVYDTAEE